MEYTNMLELWDERAKRVYTVKRSHSADRIQLDARLHDALCSITEWFELEAERIRSGDGSSTDPD